MTVSVYKCDNQVSSGVQIGGEAMVKVGVGGAVTGLTTGTQSGVGPQYVCRATV